MIGFQVIVDRIKKYRYREMQWQTIIFVEQNSLTSFLLKTRRGNTDLRYVSICSMANVGIVFDILEEGLST